MKVVWIVTLAGALVAASASADEYRDSFMANCLQMQRSAPENNRVTEAVLARYCGCIADDLSPYEMAASRQPAAARPDVFSKLRIVGDLCARKTTSRDPTGSGFRQVLRESCPMEKLPSEWNAPAVGRFCDCYASEVVASIRAAQIPASESRPSQAPPLPATEESQNT